MLYISWILGPWTGWSMKKINTWSNDCKYYVYRHSHWKHSPLWAYITFSTHSDVYWTGLSLAQQSSELMCIHCILHYITIICICLLSEPLCPALLWGCSVQWRAKCLCWKTASMPVIILSVSVNSLCCEMNRSIFKGAAGVGIVSFLSQHYSIWPFCFRNMSSGLWLELWYEDESLLITSASVWS